LTCTSVLHVPRSMPMSVENLSKKSRNAIYHPSLFIHNPVIIM
jgi:hypothetical protein